MATEFDRLLATPSCTVVVLDRPVDPDVLAARLAQTVAFIPRMLQRPAKVGTSVVWATDPSFSLESHLNSVNLSGTQSGTQSGSFGGGEDRKLLDLISELQAEPFDGASPPWSVTRIDGLDHGRGALVLRLAGAEQVEASRDDAIGGVDLLSRLIDPDRSSPPPPKVDLDAVLAADLAAANAASTQTQDPTESEQSTRTQDTAGTKPPKSDSPFDLLRRAASDVAQTLSEPGRIPQMGEAIADTIRVLGGQLVASVGQGSKPRPDTARIEFVTVPLGLATSAASSREDSAAAFIEAAVTQATSHYDAGRHLGQVTFSHFGIDEPPIPYVAGGRITHVHPLSPVADTPIRVSTLRIRDQIDVTIQLDTAVITKPSWFRGLVLRALASRLG